MASTSKEPNAADQESHRYHDINTKMKMASNIVKACKIESQEKQLRHKYVQCIDRTQSYAKTDQYLIYKCKTKNKSETSYKDFEEERDPKGRKLAISYDKLREVYIDCYVNKRIIPTTQTFEKGFEMKFSTGVSGHLNLAGFIHVKIPNTQFSMIIENPVQAQRRMKYLSAITQYRTDERDIVYIEEKCIHPRLFDGTYHMREAIKNKLWAYMCVAVSKNGILYLSYFTAVESYYKTNLLKVIELLEKPSVLVMEEKAHHEKNMCSIPTANSTKKQMSAFLTINNIPHSSEASKAELYDLIRRSKNNCKTELYSVDEILKAHGHVLLRCPNGSDNLSFLQKFWAKYETIIEEESRVVQCIKEELRVMLENMHPDQWETWERELIEREKRMYTEDLQVEEIIDRLMDMARSEKLSLQDFKQYAMDTQVDTTSMLNDVLLFDDSN